MKYITSLAMLLAGASATEDQYGGLGLGLGLGLGGAGYGRSYGGQVSYGQYGSSGIVGGGYGIGSASTGGFRYSRRSTIRPRDIKAYNAAPVDSYYRATPKLKETIKASCEFDFLGYSEATGRIDLSEAPKDLTQMHGEFTGLKPGLHALKIQEFGDLEYGCQSTGKVYNPFGAQQGHSHYDIYERRVGDIEQVNAGMKGKANYLTRDLLVQLSGPNSVMGRAMVLYAGPDSHDVEKGWGKQGMGEPIGCCVIGLALGDPKVKAKPTPKPDTKLPKGQGLEEPENPRLLKKVPEAKPVTSKPAIKAAPKVAVQKVAVKQVAQQPVLRRGYVAPVQSYTPRYAQGLYGGLPQW